VPDRTGTPVRDPGRALQAAASPRGRARARHLWQGAASQISARWDILAVIAAGGALGSLARWGLAAALPRRPGGFPWATFLTNVTGCLLIGALMVLLAEAWPPSRYLRPFLGIGVLGGYTTFSTFSYEAFRLLQDGEWNRALAYMLGSLLLALAGTVAGFYLGETVLRVRG